MPDKPRSVSFLIKPASADCNLFCDYCFYRRVADDYPESPTHRMSDSTLESLVRMAQKPELEAVSYMWQGGEPMLMGLDFFERAVELQKKYCQPGQVISNSIQTNGILITDEWARFFAAKEFLVGLSIDGPRALNDQHRFTRSRESVFDRIITASDVMKVNNVEFNILAVVTSETVDHPEEIYRFFREQGWNFLQFIECLEIVDGSIASFSVEPSSYGRFLCRLFDEWFRDGYPSVNIRLFDNLLQYHVGMKPECCMYKDDCGSYFVVEHNGDIYPCDFFVTREWLIGSIMHNSLDELFDHPKWREFARLRSIPRAECEECEWLGFCQRGCIRFRCWPQKDFGALNYFCSAYKTLLEYTKDRYRFLAWDIMRRRKGFPVPRGVGRNDQCPCGSRKKYKKCCMQYEFILDR